MRNLIQSETKIIAGSKQTPTRAPDWIWGAAFGAATGLYCTQTAYGALGGAILGSVIFDYLAVESPGLVVSKKVANLSKPY